MWLWQRKDVSPEHLLVKRLLTLSTCVHAVLLITVFFVYQGPGNTYDKTVAALVDTDATIVFLPGYKSLYHEVSGSGKAGSSRSVAHQESEEVVMPTISDLHNEPTTTLISPAHSNTDEKKAKKHKKKYVDAKKKKEHKKQKLKKKITPIQSAKKKTLDKKNARVVKKGIQKKERNIEAPQIIQTIAETAQLSDGRVNVGAVENQQEGSEHIIYVGQQEYDIMQVQEEIQREAARVWSAPRGLSQSLTCLIVVSVGKDGMMHDVSIEESSGILMYDIQARQAAHAMKFPQAAWGKEVTVYFKN